MRVKWSPFAKKQMREIARYIRKIIYYIEDDHIEVADFWEVRQDPGVLTDRVKD